MAREYTWRQFAEALKRNGFKHDALFWFKDTTGQTPGVGYPGVFDGKGKCYRRLTVAHLIQGRAEVIERNAKEKVKS